MEQVLTWSSLYFMMTGGEVSDVESELLFSDDNEDYDPSPQPSGRVVKPALSGTGQPGHENPSSPEMEFDQTSRCNARHPGLKSKLRQFARVLMGKMAQSEENRQTTPDVFPRADGKAVCFLAQQAL